MIENFLERVCGELPRPLLLRWAAIFFSFFVLTLQISIAACQAFLAVAGVLYAIHLLRTRTPIAFPPVKLPLALFCALSVVSVFWAANRAAGWFAVRKLVLFLIWLLAVNLVVSFAHLRRLLQGVFVVSLLASVVGIVQFVIEYRNVRAQHPGQVYHYMTSTRIHGFMGHWMHFGGQQMLIFPFLLAFLLFCVRSNSPAEAPGPNEENRNSKFETRNSNSGFRIPNRDFRFATFDLRLSIFWRVTFCLVVLSIILNFTRGVWLGCFLGTIYLVAQWRPRWLLVLPLLAVLGYFGAPGLLRERFQMAMHPTHEPALSIRLEMWGVALRMIRAHPWVGVGPNNIVEAYDLYLPPGKTPEPGYHSHFHNDYLQFAAERGLPCLAAWLWLMGALGWYTWKLSRGMPWPDKTAGMPGPGKNAATPARPSAYTWVAHAALAAWMAFLVEGLFEFNFGTSPVLMMFLFVTATPFIAARTEAASRSPQGAAATEGTG